MRRATALASALLVLSLLSAMPAVAAAASRGHTAAFPDLPEDATRATAPLSAAGRWIVVLRDGASVTTATGRAANLGIKVDHAFRSAVHGYSARLTGPQVARLRADPQVASVVPDELITATGQSTPRGIRRVNATESQIAQINGSDERVDADVAIVDTGIDRHHVDLNVAGGYNCYTKSGSANDPKAWGDSNGHGTHVAGTVGALDNGIGVVGVAPGVRLWAVRILDPAGDGLVSWYVCGLDWIASQRDPLDASRPLIEAVNMSVAKPGSDDHNCGLTNKDVMHQAICRLVASGVTVVAAAGNNSFSAAKLIPASYNEVITVSALADMDGKPGGLGGSLCYSWSSWDQDDTFADFSNYGHDVDLIAPGKCTYSTLPGNTYGWISGTSMAAPLVTGAAALYKASRPLATPLQVKAALIAAGNLDWNTATDPDPYHEPILDVSHIVAAGDYTVDATPGVSRPALVSAAGAVLARPVAVVRAEDFPGEVDLDAVAAAPLTVALDVASLVGLDQATTSMTITVPPATPSGTYSVSVNATDGSRPRTSTYTVVVDSDAPVAAAAVVSTVSGGTLGTTFATRATWPAATDASGSVAGYTVQWSVDGGAWGTATSTGSTARSLTRTMAVGHSYVLRIRARDAAGNVGDWVQGDAFAPRLVQDRSPTLVRTGRWVSYASTAMSGGSSVYARAKDASIARTFTGRSIALVAPRGSNRGRAQIWIDGVQVTSVGLWARTASYRNIVYARSWTASGQHTIRVVVVGTANHPRVDVDAFIVVP